MRSTRMAAVGAGLLLTVSVASACSDNSTGSDVEGKNEATGTPIKLGYINQEQAPTGSFPELREGTEAAVNYVNKDLGGVNGHPIELITCVADGTPEGAQKCASDMVQEGVVAVLNGLNFSGPSAYEILTSADIPYISQSPIQGTDFNGENAYALLGASPAQFTGEARYLAEQGAESVSIIINDTPSGAAGADILERELARTGITDVNRVKESPTATDFTAAVTQASSSDPDAIAIMIVAPGCGQILQTAKSLGVGAQFMLTTSCATPTVIDAIGDAAEGSAYMQELLPIEAHADDPEVTAFVAAMKRFAGIEKADIAALHQSGFAVTMTVADILKRAGAEPTSEDVVEVLEDPKGGAAFMDSDYLCDGSVLPGYPAICNASTRVVQMKDGELVEVTTDWLG